MNRINLFNYFAISVIIFFIIMVITKQITINGFIGILTFCFILINNLILLNNNKYKLIMHISLSILICSLIILHVCLSIKLSNTIIMINLGKVAIMLFIIVVITGILIRLTNKQNYKYCHFYCSMIFNLIILFHLLLSNTLLLIFKIILTILFIMFIYIIMHKEKCKKALF